MSYDLLSFGKASKAQARAAESARQDAITMQKNNFALTLANRGAKLSGPDVPEYLQGQESAILPYYMGDTEKQMGTDLAAAYKATGDTSYKNFKDAGNRFTTLQRSANDAVGSLYNGGMEAKQLGNFAPVAAARLKFSRQASIDGLNKTLAQINQTQATKGYGGDSYGARRMQLDANTGAARSVAGANLQNLTDVRGIKDNILSQQFQNWNLPNQMADAARQQLVAPTSSYMNLQNARANLFAPIRVGGQAFQYSALPSSYTQPFGVNAVNGLGQVASSVANGISANKQANAWQSYLTNYGNQQYMGANNNWQEGGGGGAVAWPSWDSAATTDYGSYGWTPTDAGGS